MTPRSLRRSIAAALLALLAAGCPPRATRTPASTATPLVGGVVTVGMTVADLERSVDFYSRVLGFALVSEVEVIGTDVERLDGVAGARKRVARLRLGDETLELAEYRAPRPSRPVPSDARSNDRTFQHVALVTSDMARAYAHLRRHRVRRVSTSPQRLPDWNPNAGGIEAFYFRDPDGHVLEAIRFPEGKGDPRWRRCTAPPPTAPRAAARSEPHARRGAPATRPVPTTPAGSPAASAPTAGPLFQGIDHTAIVVGDTARSLRFYRDALGLRIAGTSENWGPEQAKLNAVAGAHLRITTLRAASGPGIELLEYLAPRDGRPAPTDLAANDLAHWETTVAAPDLAATARAVGGPATTIVEFPRRPLGFSAATMVRDPDGHLLRAITQ